MPGRPKTMAKRVARLEIMAHGLTMDTFLTTPRQYIDEPVLKDPLCVAWNDCIQATMWTSHKLEMLGDMLRKRAGITESPSEAYWASCGADAAKAQAASWILDHTWAK